jgi:hypothetical protein
MIENRDHPLIHHRRQNCHAIDCHFFLLGGM